MTPDARFVAFTTTAALVSADRNGVTDVYVHDRQARTTTLVSVTANNQAGNGESRRPSISSDGRSIAFVSEASNLVANDTSGFTEAFVRDLLSKTTTRVAVSPSQRQGNGRCPVSVLGADASVVAVQSDASNLVTDDTNDTTDVFRIALS